jgi:predicted regulator of Ras-like GTPase activity (Roadblock/LC7/MglB family)
VRNNEITATKGESQMALLEILEQLSETQGVTAAILVSRDGFVIESVASSNVDAEAAGAIISTGLGTAEMMGAGLEQGAFNQAMMEYANGVAFLKGVSEDAMLAVTAATGSSLGAIRIAVRKAAEQLAGEL